MNYIIQYDFIFNSMIVVMVVTNVDIVVVNIVIGVVALPVNLSVYAIYSTSFLRL